MEVAVTLYNPRSTHTVYSELVISQMHLQGSHIIGSEYSQLVEWNPKHFSNNIQPVSNAQNVAFDNYYSMVSVQK